MQNFREELQEFVDSIIDAAGDIVEEEAVVYFKERFEEKEWNGEPWQPAKNPKKSGSLLVQSSALVNSIRPTRRTRESVVITAGYDDKVQYAEVHNEGFEGDVVIPAHTRIRKKKKQQVKEHVRHMVIPKRQFMGVTDELEERITDKIATYINNL